MAAPQTVVLLSSEDLLSGVWHRLVVRPMEIASTILAFLLLVLAMIVMIPSGYFAAWRYPGHPATAWNEVFKSIFRWYLWAGGVRVEITGLENLPPAPQPMLLAANHPSHLDGMVVDIAVGKRRATAMTAPNHSFPWPFSFWFRKIGTVDVARTPEEVKNYPTAHKPKDAIRVMIYKLTDLKKTMLIFPEGHIERIHHPTSFHTGAIRIAHTAKVPIIPVTLRGSERVFSPNRWLLRPGVIHVIFQKPMPIPDEPKLLEDRQLIDLMTNQLLCRIAQDLSLNYYTPGMALACKEVLSLHPVTRRATQFPHTKKSS